MPDLPNWAWHEYGNRVGFWRMLEVFERFRIRAALAINGQTYELAGNAAPKISESCFGNPVRADVLSNGRKVVGAAQRQTRRGLLQQGSIQVVDLTKNFADQFARELCSECYHKTLDEHLLARAHEIAEQKYETQVWLRKR